jgi:arylsulfatase A-like enzyme
MTQVLIPSSPGGLPPTEITLAAALKAGGYATACVGKWHLGCRPPFMPLDHGFDSYLGLPYSNDMSPWTQPDNPTFKDAGPHPLYRNREVISRGEPDQSQLTKMYTQEAIQFIRSQAKERPFFLYLAHTFPHVPLAASEDFKGKSRRGLYGDTVEEIDWSTGEVMKALKDAGVDRETLVVFTSDNGPWLGKKLEGGSPGPFSEGKVSTWEGGFREPAIFRWPGKIPAGKTSYAFMTAMDLFTTFLTLGGLPVPHDRPIDGMDLAPVLFENGPGREALLFYYFGEEAWAVRKGPWKLHRKTVRPSETEKWGNWPVTVHDPPLLFNVESDPGEKYDAAASHPDVVAELTGLLDRRVAEVRPGVLQR